VAVVAGGYYYFFVTNNSPSSQQNHHQNTSNKPGVSAANRQLACADTLPTDLKLGQKLMISATASTLSSASRLAAKYHLGGVILMDQATAPAVRTFVAAQSLPPLVATDQEGGTVQRYTTEGALPSEQSVVSSMTPAQAEAMIATDDKFLASQGINMNLAPVVDVAPLTGSSVLGSRIFSDDPQVVSEYSAAYVNAGLHTGVLPTIKHFPGLGAASGNTDYGPATTPSFAKLQARDIVPYEQLSGSKAAVMVGNQTVPGLTAGLPASLSYAAITTELRSKLGYQNNLVITDSLTAKAITDNYSLAAAATKSWEAGSDIALIVQTNPATVITSQQIEQIVNTAQTAINEGQLSTAEINKSALRIFDLSQKRIDACQIPKAS